MIILNKWQECSHMEDVYLDTSERISSDIKLFLAASVVYTIYYA